jgi:hypothetical protein
VPTLAATLSRRKLMSTSNLVQVFMLVVLGSLAGCATTDSAKPVAGDSKFEVRGKSYDDVWKAAVDTASRDMTILQSSKDAGTLAATTQSGMFTWGEMVGVVIRPVGNGADVYTVEAKSLSRSTLQTMGKDWTAAVLSGTKAELGQ